MQLHFLALLILYGRGSPEVSPEEDWKDWRKRTTLVINEHDLIPVSFPPKF